MAKLGFSTNTIVVLFDEGAKIFLSNIDSKLKAPKRTNAFGHCIAKGH
jgi:hypothetical protein